ncbi:hypothetical protein GCM10023092_17200 [Rurimicrobium arvi]|uniref:PKD domain-containing protein n=2 Tax=Rurimicrobium arvi TaxID=2049916 RepID=A0ABP8MTJ1_9BACT
MFLFFLLSFLLAGLPDLKAQISGPDTVCSGVPNLFSLAGTPSSAYTYTWTATPTAQATVLAASGSGSTVQWTSTAATSGVVTVTIVRPSLPTLVWTKNVTVLPEPDPQITTNTIVGCQGVKGDREKGKVEGDIIDDGACIKVCQRSHVQYTVVGGQPGSTFQWALDITKGSFSGPSTGTSVWVDWGSNVGFTFIKVKETTLAGCVKEKTVCVEIIESPDAKFSVNGDLYGPGGPGSCFASCTGQLNQFADLTPVSPTSPIVSWQWDFGDGVYSSLQFPSHAYASSGVYTVFLKVTNQCGCVGVYKVCIEVNDPDKPPMEISCPSIICGKGIGFYTINNTCPDLVWQVNGGTIINSTYNSVEIDWNMVGPSGFGEIIADLSACGGKCSPKVTAQVPIIQTTGTIVGPTTICTGKQYRFELPKWPATNFSWSVSPSSAATIVGYSQNSFEVYIVANAPFTLHCDYTNTLMLCGGSADLAINVVTPLTLSAPERVCKGTSTSVVTTVPSASGTSYTFIDPNGVTSYSGSFDVAGVWTIQASNPSYCEIDPISITVVDPPAPYTSITGETKVCFNTPYVYAAQTSVPNTIGNWSVSGGTPASTTGNSATIKWTSAGSISLTRSWADLPGCTSTPLTLSVNPATPSISISGDATPCANTTKVYTATLTGDPLDNITWSVSPVSAGSVSAGQNTMTPTITWNNTTLTSVACTLVAVITKCGNNATVNYPVTVYGIPTVTVTASNYNPCSGVPVTFTATPTPSSASITWALTGGSPSSGSGTSATTTFTNLGTGDQSFTVTATATLSGCLISGTANSTVLVKPQPNINMSPGAGSSSTIITCPPISIPLLLSTNATTTIDWYYNSASTPFLSGSTATSYTATAAGTYRVDVTNSSGCLSSVTRNIVLDPSCGPGCTLPASAGVSSKNHSITTCANSAGQAVVDVNFNGVWGTYMSMGSGMNILSLNVTGGNAYCSLPPISYSSFPNIPISGITISKPGVYPITLVIGYEVSPGVPCYKFVTENVIVPVIADFDYATNCVPGGYTLTLNEQSPILTGYSPVSGGSIWKVNGTVISSTTFSLSSYTPGSTITLEHIITVSNGSSSYTCSRTKTYVVPAVLTPAFSIATTDPTGLTSSSCAGREVVFTSLNNTGVTRWTWAFGDATGFVSTSSVTASRTYSNPSSTTTVNVVLTLTDAYGCTFNTTNSFTLWPNTFTVTSPSTYSLAEEIRCQGSPSTVTLVGVSGGYGSNTYNWFEQQTPLAATGNPISVLTDGQYWTMVTDLHGCRVPANPTPAKRAFQPLPDATVMGEHDYCPNEAIKLNGINGGTVGFTYQWQQLIGASWTNISGATAGILNYPSGLPVGTYQFRVVVTQSLPSPYSGACPATSPAFTVTVHGLPNIPFISGPSVINCADYSLKLNVASPQPGEVYNWSNGTAGNATVINHGGPYRVWATNIWGCKNHSDIDVPIEPSAYFWRFPHGCYSFCPEELPRRIDGPAYVTFAGWDWLLYGSGLPYPNGSWASSGTGVVDPLNINLDPTMGGDGNGSGNYSWRLNNGICTQVSDEMSIDMKKQCCRLDARLAYFNCVYPAGSSTPVYYGGIDIFGGKDCDMAFYTIYAIDPATGLAAGTVTPSSGPFTPGTTLAFTFDPFPGVTSVQFQVIINCNGQKCIANVEKVDLQQIPCKDISDCPIDAKWEYFDCKWPKGASSPTFVAGVGVSNPLGCAATSFTITAVDPATGLPNGTVYTSSSTIPPGWSSIYFTYTPASGATAVRFMITFVCDGRVCVARLGEFYHIDDHSVYPCTDFGRITAEAAAAGTGATRMLLAPNPASDEVQISYQIANWKQSDVYQVSVVNLLGITVATYNVPNAQGVWKLPTQNLVSGTYIVRMVKAGKKVDAQNLIITH